MADELQIPEDLIKKAGLEQLRATTRELSQKNEEIAALKQQLAAREIGAAAAELSSCWLKTLERRDRQDIIRIDDPVYGQFSLPGEIGPVYAQPLVKRLHFVKQLSFAHLAFPSALHSRLSHSLGVCRNATLAIQTILSKGFAYSRQGRAPLRMVEDEKKSALLKAAVAALLHDIGHGPFGHSLDRYAGYCWPEIAPTEIPDKILSAKYIREYLADAISASGLNPSEIAALIDPTKSMLEGLNPLIADVVDSPLDVDRLDYLMRDAHATGLAPGTIDICALIDCMVPFEEASSEGPVYMLAFDPSSVPYIEHFCYARDAMFIRCYENEVKLAGEGMLVKAVAEFVPQPAFGDLMLLTDQELMNLIFQYGRPNSVSRTLVQQLLHGETFELVLSEPVGSKEQLEGRRELTGKDDPRSLEIRAWWRDASHQLPAHRKSAYFDIPRQWEQKIADRANLQSKDGWKILVMVPPAHIYFQRDIAVNILVRDGQGYTTRELGDVSDVVGPLLDILRSVRLKVRVFASPDLSQPEKDRVRDAARDLLGPFPPTP